MTTAARRLHGVSRLEWWVLDALAVAGLTLGAGALRFWHLGGQSLWLDEVVTWDLLHRSLFSLVRHGVPGSESTPPLYYVVAWCWVRLFGWSEAALRSLSAMLGTATIPIAYLAGRVLAGRRAALLTALFVAVSPVLIWYSQEARAYAMFVFFSALSLLFFARLWSRYSRADLIGWSAVAALSLATHYFALFLVLAETFFLWRRLSLRQLLPGLIAPTLTCLLLAPFVWLQRSNAAGLASSTPLRTRLAETAQWFAAADLRSWVIWLIAAAVTLCGLSLLAGSESQQRKRGTLALTLAATATLLPILLALTGQDYVFFRNLIAVWLPLTVAIAAGLADRRFRSLGIAAAAVLAAAFLYTDNTIRTQPALQRDNYRLLAQKLRTTAHTVFVVYPGWDTRPIQHYQTKLHRIASPPAHLHTRHIVLIGIASNFQAWIPPQQLRLALPAGFHLVASERIQRFVLRRYLAPRPITIKKHLELKAATAKGRIPPLTLMR